MAMWEHYDDEDSVDYGDTYDLEGVEIPYERLKAFVDQVEEAHNIQKEKNSDFKFPPIWVLFKDDSELRLKNKPWIDGNNKNKLTMIWNEEEHNWGKEEENE